MNKKCYIIFYIPSGLRERNGYAIAFPFRSPINININNFLRCCKDVVKEFRNFEFLNL